MFGKVEFLVKYRKNGANGQIIIKAKTKNDAMDKFNRKFGFVEDFSIKEKGDKND